MTKTECVEQAVKAIKAREEEIKRAALYIIAFGANSDLAKSSQARIQELIQAQNEWGNLSVMHHTKRAALLRSGKLPLCMFGL